MTTPLSTSPGDGYQRAKLIVNLGPSLPVGKEGWVKAEGKKGLLRDDEQAFQFVSATNQDLVFRVYADEIELL